MEFWTAEKFRQAYQRGKEMMENPTYRQAGIRHLLSVLRNLEVNKDAKGIWWLACRMDERPVNNLIQIASLAEAMDVSKRLISKQKELSEELVGEDFPGEYDIDHSHQIFPHGKRWRPRHLGKTYDVNLRG